MLTIENHLIKTRSIRNLPKNKDLIHFSKKNRHAGILGEVLFWQQVHKGKFYGINFNRQKIIGNYIVDFYVPSLSLVVEIDGSSHNCEEELFLYHLFRHPTAENAADLLMILAVGCHLFLTEEKELRAQWITRCKQWVI